MEKLSNQQIDAIAYDIKDQVQKAHKKENDVKQKAAHIAFYKTKEGKIHKLYHETFKLNPLHTGLDKLAGFTPKTEYFDLQKIRTKVILATIECKDYKDLVNKILAEFL